MPNRRYNCLFTRAIATALVAFCWCQMAHADTPDVPSKYQRLFVRYTDSRSFSEKVLNLAGISENDVGKSFALIAGVSHYPNMPVTERDLRPAAEDIKRLVAYLESNEFFDEIVVLQNKDMNYENLQFFLQTYFPARLKKFPKSRFLFAYSGHGMTENGKGYLLTSSASSLTDKRGAIPLDVVRVLFDDIVVEGYHVLALINSCYSGGFLRRSFGGKRFLPKHKGAHAITAGGSNELTWHDPRMGPGSIFFEKVFAALDGYADVWPTNTDGSQGDGVITVDELTVYLKNEIQIFTDQNQNPSAGDISKHGSRGGFFFLNRRRQVAETTVPEWDPDSKTALGDSANLVQTARQFYDAANYQAAYPLFLQAAGDGNLRAMEFLGYMYEKNFGVAQNYDEALRWYRLAASMNSGWAMNQIGLIYDGGTGVPEDDAEAADWYRRAAEAGDSWGMNNLGMMYFHGHGIGKDLTKALVWLEASAEAGNSRAMNQIGWMYDRGIAVQQDYNIAMDWYRRSAKAGNSEAMNNLGYLYDHGYGVAKDQETAALWYRKGAELDHVWAMANLGNAYLWGRGVEKNYSKALHWSRKAQAEGNNLARANLGYMYEHGLQVPKDMTKATQLYREAAADGYEWAESQLERLNK